MSKREYCLSFNLALSYFQCELPEEYEHRSYEMIFLKLKRYLASTFHKKVEIVSSLLPQVSAFLP